MRLSSRKSWVLISLLLIQMFILLEAETDLRGLTDITVVADDNYPPYVFRDINGELVGILPEMWVLWEEQTGIRANFVAMDWGKAQQFMLQGQADVIETIFFNETRARVLDFTKPYTSINVPIFFHQNISGISDIKSLKGFTVGVKEGDACIEVLNDNGITDLEEFPNYESIIRSAMERKIHIFCVDEPPALYYLHKFDLENEFRMTSSLYTGRFHRAVHKGDKALLKIVEEGFARIPPEKIDQIHTKWMGKRLFVGWFSRYSRWLSIGVMALIFVLALLSAILGQRIRKKNQLLTQALGALKENNEKLRILVEGINDPVFSIDCEGRYLYVNPPFAKPFGLLPEQIIGHTLWDLFSKSDADQRYTGIHWVIANKTPKTIDVKVLNPQTGTTLDYVTTISPRIDDKGQVTGVLCTSKEVTDFVRVQEELRHSREMLSAIVTNARDLIFIKNTDFQYILVNPAMCRLFGLQESEFPGKTDGEVFGHPYFSRDTSLDYRVTNGETIEEETTLSLQGKVMFFHTVKVPLWDESGNITGLCCIARDMTEKNTASERIRKMEEHFQIALRMSDSSSFELDVRSGRISFSPALFEKLGITGAEIPESIEALIAQCHPEDQPSVNNEVQRNIRGETASLFLEFRLRDQTGNWVWVSGNGRVVSKDDTGIPSRILGILQDISIRKTAEEAFRISEKRFRELADMLPQSIYECSIDGGIIYANHYAFEEFGYTEEEFGRGLNVMQMIAPEDRPRAMEAIKLLVSGVQTGEREYMALKRDGTRMPIIIHSALNRDRGEVIGFRGTIVNISQLRKVESQIRENEERFRIIAEQTGQLIYDLNIADGRIEWSGPITLVTGYTEQDFRTVDQHKWRELIHPEDRDFVDDTLKACMETGDLFDCTYRFRRPDDTWVHVSDRGAFLRNESGELWRMLGTKTDITRHVKAEEQQRNLTEQLRQSQKMEAIGHLAGSIAHDFNNLLSPLIGYTEIMLWDMAEDSPFYRMVKDMQSASLKAKELIQQLLAFSRKQILQIQVVDLASIVRDFEGIIRRTLREDIQLAIELDQEAGRIRADTVQIEQILMNLTVNAQDAMPNGGRMELAVSSVRLSAPIKAEHAEIKPGEYVKLTLSDTGSGIPYRIREQIFEPFFTTKIMGKGTGLGLSTVLGIVQQHAGFITIQSEEGRGTTFDIYFPRVEEYGEKATANSSFIGKFMGSEIILLVEDNTIVRDLARTALETAGYRVVNAENPSEAGKLAEQQRQGIDLLVTDVVMPGMNGRQFYEIIRETMPGLKVLYMSGYSSNVISHHGVLDEGVDFIAKPFTIQAFLKKVREILDRRR